MKFSVAHYKKADSDWWVNGGKFIVTDSEYVLKGFLKTVARFEAEKTKSCKIPDNMLYKGISISDGEQSYELYFFSKTASEVYRILKIQ